MSPRPKLQLPFGGGLDRDSGVLVVDPKAQEDLRNVDLTDGLAFIRPGSDEASTVTDPAAPLEAMTSVIGGEWFKIGQCGVIVAWRESTREVHVYRVNAVGEDPTHVAHWFTLGSGASEPPQVWFGEVAGRMAIAHDEPALAVRAPTVLFDPDADTLSTITEGWAHGTTLNSAGNDNSIRAASKQPIGEEVTITLVDPAGNNVPLSVAVVGNDITVTLETDGGSTPVSTAAEVVDAIQADADADALVEVAVNTDDGGAGTGAGVMAAIAETVIAPDGLRFRGVTSHLDVYLAGWGYGTYAEDRPDFVRMSMPNEPDDFQLRHYESVGSQGEPVLACQSLTGAGEGGGTLLCFNAFGTWNHFGTERRNFGKRQVDGQYGLLGAHLVQVVNIEGGKVCLAWSKLGPRIVDGGGSADAGLPLGLHSPEPADLVAKGDDDTKGFACLVPSLKPQVRFYFGRRYYAFHTETKRWSYGETDFEPSCAFLLPATEPVALAAAIPDVTYQDPAYDLSDVPNSYMPQFSVEFTFDPASPLPAAGDRVEIWVRSLYAGATVDSLGGGDDLAELEWKKRATVAITATPTVVRAMHFFTDHEVALRVTRGGMPGTGYTGAPDAWPAGSRVTVTANGQIDRYEEPAYSRPNANEIQLTVDYGGPGMNGQHLQPQLTLTNEKSLAGAGVWSSYGADPGVILIANADRHQEFDYRHKVEGPEGSDGFLEILNDWAGPDRPTSILIDASLSPGTDPHDHDLHAGGYGDDGGDVEFRGVHLRASDDAPGAYSATETVVNPGALDVTVTVDDAPGRPQKSQGECRTKVDHGGGLIDYSEWIIDQLPGTES